MHNNPHRDEDYLPYTNSYHQKAPYLVWEDRYTPHRKHKKKRCQIKISKCCKSTSAIVTIVSIIIVAIFAIISLSAYLGVITNFYPASSIFILHGKLLMDSEDVSTILFNISSDDSHVKTAKYQELLQSIYDQSDLQKCIKTIRVHTFENHSLSIYFHIYLDQDRLSNISIGDTPKIAKKILSRALENLHLDGVIRADISLLENFDLDFPMTNTSESTEKYLLMSTESKEIMTDYQEVTENYSSIDEYLTTVHTKVVTYAEESTEEIKNVESHQRIKKPFVVNYGAWLPFIPTSNPVPTDKIITIPFSSSVSKDTIDHIDVQDDDEDLLEERRLRQSVDVNSSQILHKLLSLKDSKSTSSISFLQNLRNETTKISNSSSSELFAVEGTALNDKQAWVPIFVTKQPKGSTSGHHETNDTSILQTTANPEEEHASEEESISHSSESNLHHVANDSRWRGYSMRRSDIDTSQTYFVSGRTGIGEAHLYPLEPLKHVEDPGFIPVTPVSTTELTVGASLYIHLNRRNRPHNSSYGNLRRIYPPSTTRRTSFEVETPLFIRNSQSQSSFDSGYSKSTGQFQHRIGPLHGSEFGSLNVERTLSLKRSNRSLHIKSVDHSLGDTFSAPRFLKDFVGVAKVIPSDMPANMKLSSTIKPLQVKGDAESQKKNLETSETSKEIKTDADVISLQAFSSKKKDVQIEKHENETSPQYCNQGFRCGNEGECLPWSMRCNRRFECGDSTDEMNCSCIEYFWAQRLHSKICDGIIDCWDQSDELGCPWCSMNQFICPNSKKCIDKSKVCDGIQDCPFGSDEDHCMKLVQSPGEYDRHHYNSEGLVAIRKNGVWGMMCSENLHSSPLERLGQSVCSILTYRNFNSSIKSVEVASKSMFYQLQQLNTLSRSSTDVQSTDCKKKEMIRVICNSLECGLRSIPSINRSRIIGGQSSQSGSWPWQVALYREGEFQCGAVLLNNRWLMTAAHCFFHSKTSYWTARMGLLRRGNEYPTPYEEIRVISNILIYPGYKEVGFVNDIALLGMSSPVKFSDYIRPVCLPQVHEDIKQWNNHLCTVVGWGKLFEVGHLFPDTLQEVWLPVVDTEECRKRTIFLPLYKITEQMFCAGYERGGRDACLGDSGGPLLCQRSDGRWTVVGITSNGDGCGRPGRPGVYTKVTSFLSWIHSILENDPASIVTAPSCNGHRCNLGKCVAKKDLCNGVMDCWDGSDERCSIKR